MSQNTDVPADSFSTDVKNDQDIATSTNAQVSVDSSQTVSDTHISSDAIPHIDSVVPNSSSEDKLCKDVEQSRISPGSVSVSDTLNDTKSDIGEGAFTVETTSVSSSSLEPVMHTNSETDKVEISDDGSDYKDAVVNKEEAQEISDSDSQAGSESSIEGVSAGRRNKRPDEAVKDNYSDDESSGKEGTDYEPQGTRESGDGEEKGKEKVVDRDEDKKDPQYIPKKGVFYEHDDRTADSGPANTAEEPKDTKKKKVIADKIDRWGHDMYDTEKQSPKSTQDLIDYYGYDIRNEEEPPKAWRSRRYGRGPNKYTRQWQDEAAYRTKRPQLTKPPPALFKNNIEDFPTVEQSKSGYRRNRNRNLKNTREGSERDRPRSQNQSLSPKEPRSESRRKLQSGSPPPHVSCSNAQPLSSERAPLPKENKYKDIQIEKTIFLNKKKPFSSNRTKSEAEAEADLAALSKEFSNAVINLGRDGKILPIGSHGTVPQPPIHVEKVERIEVKEKREPHLVEQHMGGGGVEMRVKDRRDIAQNAVTSKSKRYSSQRQRSLPQSNHIPQQQQGSNQQAQQQPYLHQQQYFQPPPPPPPTAPDNVPDSAMFSGFQSTPPPPVYTDSMQGVVFLPGYPPTPAPHLLNYCPPPQQFGMPPPLGPPPPDMFPAQPPPGITYYSPQSQVQPRPPASRRVKVAIPIVAPPDQQSQPDPTCS